MKNQRGGAEDKMFHSDEDVVHAFQGEATISIEL